MSNDMRRRCEIALIQWLYLQETDGDPRVMMRSLNSSGYSDALIREAMWRLIDAGDIALTDRRQLRIIYE